MTSTREELIRRNKNFIQIPMPALSEMTNEELERRAFFLEKSFEIEFSENDCEDEDL